MVNPSLKDTKEGASAKTAGRELHKGTVRGLHLKESEDWERCMYLFEWVDLFLVVEGVNAAGMTQSYLKRKANGSPSFS